MNEEDVLKEFSEKNYSKDSVETRVYEIALKYKYHSSVPFFESFESIKNDLVEAYKSEIFKLERQCEAYLNEIRQISKQLVDADEFVKEEILNKERIKQQLFDLRIENSNLVLINRKLRQLLKDSETNKEKFYKIERMNSAEASKERHSKMENFERKFSDEQEKIDENRRIFEKNSKIQNKKFKIKFQNSVMIPSIKIKKLTISTQTIGKTVQSTKKQTKAKNLIIEPQQSLIIRKKAIDKVNKRPKFLRFTRPELISINSKIKKLEISGKNFIFIPKVPKMKNFLIQN